MQAQLDGAVGLVFNQPKAGVGELDFKQFPVL
jgi:hypothetical protein